MSNKLNRYTTFPILIDILQRLKLPLQDPRSWADRNDCFSINKYKEIEGIENLYIICFSESDETVHNWESYSNCNGGCCIEFYKDKLIERINNIDGVFHREVKYLKISEFKSEEKNLYPFLKRAAFECESEYRIISKISNSIDIDLNLIKKITFSQKMPQSVFDSVKKLILNYFKGEEIEINHSTLYENTEWKSKF